MHTFAGIDLHKDISRQTAQILLRMTEDGITPSARHEQMIRSAGYGKELSDVKSEAVGHGSITPDTSVTTTARHLWLFEVPVATQGDDIGKPFEGSAYFDKIPQEWKDKWAGKEILRSHWRPSDPRHMDDEFYRFIDSHIPQFNELIPYEPFYLYCEQARRWLEDKRTISDIPVHERPEWKRRELERIADNKLYGLDKYATIKEDGFLGGRRQFKSSAPHAVVAYLIDRGNHFDLVKGRQAALTSMMMAVADLMMIVTPSFTGVFMVHKKDGTGKGLFRDKHQSTLQHFPSWITREIDVSKGFSTESTILDFDPGDTKATKGMDVSTFHLLSAEDSMVVNGKTPTLSLFDEAQNIPTYQKIKAEIDPTLYQFNPFTGKMDLVRQICGWGTGSSNNTGQGAFENDFKALLESWQGRQDTSAWVPLFFDWTCRPGMTLEFYMEQRRKYLRGQTEETKGLSPAERLSLFHAHYPSKPDDAFMSTHKTLVPMELIVNQQQRIEQMCHKAGLRPTPGRFIPIFDESVTLQGDLPFMHPVIGAEWKPLANDDIEAPVRMFMPPEKMWANRYFQGTDPIQNDGGFSRFSSVIWDAAGRQVGVGEDARFIPTVACVLNSRSYDPTELFIQNALMGIYYRNHGQKACKELVEINAGHRYVDFKIGPIFNLRETLLTRHQLLPRYKTGNATNLYGIDLKGGKGSRKELLYGDVVDLLLGNWHNIWYYDIWSQIRYISVETKPDGSVAWGTKNKNVYNDDMVYAMGYAELCCRCVNQQPEYISIDSPKMITKRVIVRDANLNPWYQTVQIPANY